ncbi:MAG: hypothetical protein MUF24_12665, partial [Chitinophagaceae bacterium]|nr:hypothetical protein [Chitinophagaceae bacterium]
MKLTKAVFACCTLCLGLFLQCKQPKVAATAPQDAPAWAADVVWYQIFVERFNNGDTTNDPTAADIAIPPIGVQAPAGWKTTPWTADWYTRDSWADTAKRFHETLQYRRY